MYGKWLDPIMSLIAGYEIIRRGKLESLKENLKTVIGNLRNYFPGIPDTEVLARLIGLKAKLTGDPPLLMDGVLALEDTENLTLPPSKLDYASPWTSWRGAVSEVTVAGKALARKGRATTSAGALTKTKSATSARASAKAKAPRRKKD